MSHTMQMDRRNALMGLGSFFATAGLLPTVSAAQTPGKRYPARIVSSQGNQVVIMQELVKSQGYLDQFGLDSSILTVSDGNKLVGALVSGESDLSIFAGFNQVLAAVARGAKMKIIGGASITGQQAVFSAKPEIRTIQDLKGRTVGAGALGSQLHQVMTALLRKHGVDPASVTFLNVGSSGDVFRAIAGKIVDAGPAQADIFNQLDKYKIHFVEGGLFAKDLPEYTWQASFAMEKVIAEKRDMIVRVLAAYLKAYRFVQEDSNSKEAFIQARWRSLGGQNFETAALEATGQWEYVQQNKPYALDLKISRERVEYMQRLNVEAGSQKVIVPFEQVADFSMAEEAVKLAG